MGARWIAEARGVALLLCAGCFAKPPRPFATCGNGTIEPEEVCDDGNVTDTDGCSATCQIEPWFECAAAGEPCRPVLGLAWTAPGTLLPPIGGGGGGDFEFDCPTLAGTNGFATALVGLDGATEAATGANVVATRAVCADLELAADGSIRWAAPIVSPEAASTAATNPQQLRCATDEIVTGFDGNAGGFVSGIELLCQAVTHRGGVLAFGARRKLDQLGPGGQLPQPTALCADGEVARGIAGRAGAVIDSFTLRCVPTRKIVCGDGQLDDNLETCDDGNAAPDDGCNPRCNGA